MSLCKDCHSNQTEWPWYSNIAPVSWFVQDDVDQGRSRFDVSEWGRSKRNKGKAAADEVRKGDMPLPKYTILHSNARLTSDEKQKLIDGLIKTFGEE